MAPPADRHPRNAPGDWYVDTRCIACDASRHHAPGLIGALPDGRSFVTRQPASPDEETALWRATLACPTRSIGTLAHRAQPPAVFPHELTAGVFLCGHNDRRSFGAHSWFVPGTASGFLVDSPRWNHELVGAFEAAGGIDHVLLTHRDDVADAQRYAEHFDAKVWIHRADLDAAPFATDILGDDETLIAPGLVGFPVPGHTEGSVLYLHQERHLFTGDTLAWLWRDGDLGAFRDATWFSWSELPTSLARFLASGHRFDWVCPAGEHQIDLGRGGVELEVLPCEPECLGGPEPIGDEDGYGGVRGSVAVEGGEQAGHLGRFQGAPCGAFLGGLARELTRPTGLAAM